MQQIHKDLKVQQIQDKKSVEIRRLLRLRSEPEKLSVFAASVSILTSGARLSSRSKILKISSRCILGETLAFVVEKEIYLVVPAHRGDQQAAAGEAVAVQRHLGHKVCW